MPTVASLLFPVDPEEEEALERYRIFYEQAHGPTDPTARFTSQYSQEDQNLLIEKYLKRYFDGLPPFAQGWLYKKMKTAQQEGRLGEVEENWRELFLSGQMEGPANTLPELGL